ncbi:MAG: FAD binding domain-containing protein [Rhodobacter sp.]|nr:FAD binding domain-containing protein [Rhodobacter sp.]
MTYHRPTNVDEALGILADGGFCVAAGCTDLYPATTAKALPGPVLDITAIPALRGISRTGDGWRIGATTTWTDIVTADLPPAFDCLKLAAREIGSVQIQTAGTVAGNLCTASPAADAVPCLLTLDAQVELRSATSTRVLPLSRFLTGPRQTARAPGELVTAILVADGSARGTSHFLKLGARKYLVISIAMAAVRLEIDRGVIARAALAIGACSPVATRLPDLERILTGQSLDRAAASVVEDQVAAPLTPIDDMRGDAAYRVDAATELLRRSLAALASAARETA